MLATLIIVFREMIEAGLIVGIVLSATVGVPKRGMWVTYGVIAGLLGACIVASFAGAISAMMEGYGQELFNVAILSFAVVMLAWHNVWMARHGRVMSQELKQVGAEVKAGTRSLLALAIVIAVAVLREGSEVVLFLYGILVSGQDSAASMALGGFGGIVLGAVLTFVMYRGLLRIPVKSLFKVTSWLIALLAAGMAAQAVSLLQQAQIITGLSDVVWNSSAFISDRSLAGKVLHTLIGYTARPTEAQLLVYGTVLVVIFTLMRLFGHVPQKPLVKPASA
jgi:high-affinity iron transporter